MNWLTTNCLGLDYALGDLTVDDKGLRELVEMYGERLADADWRYQEFRCRHLVDRERGASSTTTTGCLIG